MEQMRRPFTGDPFVDMGDLVIKTLPPKKLEDKLRFATDVYVNKWKGKLHSIFLHSKITHISAKNPEQKYQNSLKYYLGLLGNNNQISEEGYCRICAQQGRLFESGRDTFPLIGSGEFVNFHHFHDNGLLFCKDCLINAFFIPLGILECGDRLMMLQVQDQYTAQFWKEEVIQKNLDKMNVGSSEGILKSTLFRPQNALFYLAGEMIERYDGQPSTMIRLLYFTNFGSKPDIEIYDLPNPIFIFLRRVLKPDLEKDWRYFVKRHFRIKSANFDEESGEWLENKKDSGFKLDFQDYVGKKPNIVFDYLLSGKSILGMLRRFHRSKPFPVMIAVSYLKEVKRMRQEQIDLIRNIADKIINLSQKEANFKKFITPIEGARYAHQLRIAIIRLVKAHYKNGEAEPFIRFQDYVEFLFPDGQGWAEVRDFLLICLYEKLHDLRIEPEQIDDDLVMDIAEGENTTIDNFNI